MAILEMIGVPPTSFGVYAVIFSKATGLAWSPSYSAFIPSDHQYCGINLSEDPPASRVHTAPFPDLPAGEYRVVYFDRITSPLNTDEPNTSEDVTIGSTGGTTSVSIAVQPITSEPVSPKVYDDFIEVYQSTNNTVVLANLVDATNTPIDLTGKTLRFIVYGKSSTHFQVENSQITVDSSAGTSVSVEINSTQTARIMDANFVLRNLTDEIVLACGEFYVTKAPTGDE